MERKVIDHRPDVIVAQGDTTTVLVSAMTAFFVGIEFAHVEAGLRTGNLRAPFPEEFNRVTAGRLASWNFCPTRRAYDALLAEGADPSTLHLTGNTGIDALRLTLDRLGMPQQFSGRRRILLTAHRRENQGARMQGICRAVRTLVDEFDDIEFVIPVHPNPAVSVSFEQTLNRLDRVTLSPPLSYQDLVRELAAAVLIVTDSGGIQEEAPFLHKPVLVMRDVTERPEAVDMGVAALIGTDEGNIVRAVRRLLSDPDVYARMAAGGSPYGDGYAAQRIASAFGLPAKLRACEV
jgi:UDP-N-acetylglucosamine 2-epimerase (non-hydrolysing)